MPSMGAGWRPWPSEGAAGTPKRALAVLDADDPGAVADFVLEHLGLSAKDGSPVNVRRFPGWTGKSLR